MKEDIENKKFLCKYCGKKIHKIDYEINKGYCGKCLEILDWKKTLSDMKDFKK